MARIEQPTTTGEVVAAGAIGEEAVVADAMEAVRRGVQQEAPDELVGRKPKLAPHDEAIRARVAACPDATLEELQAWLADERKVKVSMGCLWNRLKFLKLPLKKSRNEPPNKSGRMLLRRALTGLPTSLR